MLLSGGTSLSTWTRLFKLGPCMSFPFAFGARTLNTLNVQKMQGGPPFPDGQSGEAGARRVIEVTRNPHFAFSILHLDLIRSCSSTTAFAPRTRRKWRGGGGAA